MVSPVCRNDGQRIDVGRHPGHDPAGQLALVVVQPEPLQLREHLDPQRVEQPFAVAAGDQGLHRVDHPVGQHDGQREQRDHDDHVDTPWPVRRCRCRPGPARAGRCWPARRGHQDQARWSARRRTVAAAWRRVNVRIGGSGPRPGSPPARSLAGGSASTFASNSGRRRHIGQHAAATASAARRPPPAPQAGGPAVPRRRPGPAAELAEAGAALSGAVTRPHKPGVTAPAMPPAAASAARSLGVAE